MRSLTRKGWRDLTTRPATCAGLALLVAVVTLPLLGGLRARRMIAAARDECCESLALADLEVRFEPAARGLEGAARRVPGVRDAEERLLAEGVLEIPGARPVPALIHVLPEGAPQRICAWGILDGRLPAAGESALLLDRSVREVHGLAVGARATVRFQDQVRTLPVVGVARSPEYLLFPVHPEFNLPMPDTVAVVAVSQAATAGIPRADLVNSLLLRLDRAADRGVVGRRLEEALAISLREVSVPREGMSYRITAWILEMFDLYLPIVVSILGALGLFAFAYTMRHVVGQERAATGVLLSLGHAPGGVAVAFLPLALVAAGSGVAAAAAASGLLARSVYEGYRSGLGLLPALDAGPGVEILAALLAWLGMAAVSVLAPALSGAREPVAHLLKPRVRASVRDLVRRLPALPRVFRLPLSVTLGWAHVVRRVRATLMIAVALGATFAATMAFLCVHVSHRREVAASAEATGLDATIHFERPVGEEVLSQVAARVGGAAHPVVAGQLVLVGPTERLVVRGVCARPGPWTKRLRLSRGRPLAEGPDAGGAEAGGAHGGDAHAEILVDEHVARSLSVDVGDPVTCYARADAPEGTTARVVGVLAGLTTGLVVLPIGVGQSLYGLGAAFTAAHVESPLAPHALEETLWGVEGARVVYSLARARRLLEADFEGAEILWTWGVVLAALTAIVFLGIVAALDATERGPQFALLDAFGWRPSSLATWSLTEVGLRGVVALLVAIPLAPLLGAWILARVTVAHHYHAPLVTPGWVFGLMTLATLVLLPLAAWPAWRAARRLSAARTIRFLAS